MPNIDDSELIDEVADRLAQRRWAASVGGFLAGFVLGDRGLASNGVGTLALAVGLGLLAFSWVR